MGVGRKTTRRRAVGTRERILAHLTEDGELSDANGMASTRLAAAVSYPGSSVAFAQLLSGMERSGLIEREVRGKRTYRIGLGPSYARSPAGGSVSRESGSAGTSVAGVASGAEAAFEAGRTPEASGTGGAGFDYDELARRLLVQVVRRLAATEHSQLAEENVRLREQLRAAQRSLAMAAEHVRKLPTTAGLDRGEAALLQRLLCVGVEGASVAGPGDGVEGAQEDAAALPPG